jgi:hypothetical protein
MCPSAVVLGGRQSFGVSPHYTVALKQVKFAGFVSIGMANGIFVKLHFGTGVHGLSTMCNH